VLVTSTMAELSLLTSLMLTRCVCAAGYSAAQLCSAAAVLCARSSTLPADKLALAQLMYWLICAKRCNSIIVQASMSKVQSHDCHATFADQH
jgi:hypothetical protein